MVLDKADVMTFDRHLLQKVLNFFTMTGIKNDLFLFRSFLDTMTTA